MQSFLGGGILQGCYDTIESESLLFAFSDFDFLFLIYTEVE